MRFLKYFILVVFCFLISSIAVARPLVSNVSGIFGNGQSIEITGSSFTSKSRSAPLLSSYDDETLTNNWSNGLIGGLWEVRDDDGSLTLSNDFTRSSHSQSSYNITYNAAGGYNSIRYQHNTPEEVMYVSFWMYRDSATLDLSGTEMNSKFFRIYNTTAVGDANLVWSVVDRESVGSDIYKSYMSGDYLGASVWNLDYSAIVCNGARGHLTIFFAQSKETACKPVMRTWEHYEILIEYPSSLGTADGKVLQLKDGATFARSSSIMIGESGQSETMRFPMVGQVSGGRNHSYYEYIDQVYIDNTPAHIYISDSPNASWPDIDHFNHSEIQVASAWSDSSITFTFNQGTFAEGNTAYVYVVDVNGTSNSEGYPITIGGGGLVDAPPVITITDPSTVTYIATASPLSLSGTSSDDNGVSSVSWSNNRGGSGTVSGGLASWALSGVTLFEGENIITVIAQDTTGQTSSDHITVSYDFSLPTLEVPKAFGLDN